MAALMEGERDKKGKKEILDPVLDLHMVVVGLERVPLQISTCPCLLAPALAVVGTQHFSTPLRQIKGNDTRPFPMMSVSWCDGHLGSEHSCFRVIAYTFPCPHGQGSSNTIVARLFLFLRGGTCFAGLRKGHEASG